MNDIADIILHGGTVLTVDTANTVAEAIALKGERILCVGTAQDLRKFQAEHTQLIDLQGDTVVPGMIDNHTHQLLAGLDRVRGGKVNIAHCNASDTSGCSAAAPTITVGLYPGPPDRKSTRLNSSHSS